MNNNSTLFTDVSFYSVKVVLDLQVAVLPLRKFFSNLGNNIEGRFLATDNLFLTRLELRWHA